LFVVVVSPGTQDSCSGIEVAKAHIAAAEHGRLGHNYILAGETITLKSMVDQVSGIHDLGFDCHRIFAM
jgi:hypothetical protein